MFDDDDCKIATMTIGEYIEFIASFKLKFKLKEQSLDTPVVYVCEYTGEKISLGEFGFIMNDGQLEMYRTCESNEFIVEELTIIERQLIWLYRANNELVKNTAMHLLETDEALKVMGNGFYRKGSPIEEAERELEVAENIYNFKKQKLAKLRGLRVAEHEPDLG